jgi:hypothetical protein
MTELPQPDVMDQAGRAKRLVLGLIIGAACAAIAYLVCSHLTAGTHDNFYNWKGGPTKFVWYMTGLFGAFGLVVTLAITNQLAKNKWRKQLVAQAKVVKTS